MNKVVTRETLASALPRELRGDIDPTHTVRVTVEDVSASADAPTSQPERGTGHFSRHFGRRRDDFRSMEDIVAHIRAVRDGDERAGR